MGEADSGFFPIAEGAEGRTRSRPDARSRRGCGGGPKRAGTLLRALLLIIALLAAGGALHAAGGRDAGEPSGRADERGAGSRGGEVTAAGGGAGGTEAAEPAGSAGQAGGETAEGGGQAPSYEYTEPDFGTDRVAYPFLVLRTLAILAVIVIAIFLIFRVFLKNRNKVVAGTDIVKVLGTYPLSGNRSIQVVEIAEKVYILGITDSSINLISTVEDKETIDRIKLKSSKETKGFQSFKDQLLKLISGKAFTGQGQISNFNDFKQRINKMKKM